MSLSKHSFTNAWSQVIIPVKMSILRVCWWQHLARHLSSLVICCASSPSCYNSIQPPSVINPNLPSNPRHCNTVCWNIKVQNRTANLISRLSHVPLVNQDDYCLFCVMGHHCVSKVRHSIKRGQYYYTSFSCDADSLPFSLTSPLVTLQWRIYCC